jgi:hypothetical protein
MTSDFDNKIENHNSAIQERINNNSNLINTNRNSINSNAESFQGFNDTFTHLFDEDFIKDISNNAAFVDRLDSLESSFATSEILKVDPELIQRYDILSENVRIVSEDLKKQQQKINNSLNPHVEKQWTDINAHVENSLKPYINRYIEQKLIEDISNTIGST